MDITYQNQSLHLSEVPKTYDAVCKLVEDFFALENYRLRLKDKVTGFEKPLIHPDDYTEAAGTVIVDTQHFSWESLATEKSFYIPDSNSSDESVVDQAYENSESEVLVSEPDVAPPPKQQLLLYRCTYCRKTCSDTRLRRCLPCGYYLCGVCEDTHMPSHPILYYNRRTELPKNPC